MVGAEKPADKASSVGIGGSANEQPSLSKAVSTPEAHKYGTLGTIKEETSEDLIDEELSTEQVAKIEVTVDVFLEKFTKE